jgi:hypothetical protein
MRAFKALTIVALLAGFAFQDAKPFTLKKDSAMSYVDIRTNPLDGSTKKTDLTWTISKVEGDKTFMSSTDGIEYVYQYANGFFCWGNGDGADPGLRVFKVGAKKGDTWAPSADSEGVTLTYVGDEEVATPAGKLQCKKMVLIFAGHLRITFHFADKVGLVKGLKEISLDGTGTEWVTVAVIELQKFVEGK